MLNQHPITPPPELVQQCWDELRDQTQDLDAAKAWGKAITLAYQAGADQELQACCTAIDEVPGGWADSRHLRHVRRPKPPTLKEQALAVLMALEIDEPGYEGTYNTIRRALEALDD